MTATVADVAVVGDGIAGLTVAHECALRGLRVALCGSLLHGAATPASAGVLGPSMGARPADDPVQKFMTTARDVYPEFLSRLRTLTGADVPTVRGIIEFPGSNAALDVAERATAAGSVLLSRDEVAELEPALPRGWVAIYHDRDGAVDVPALFSALHRAIDYAPEIARHGMALQVRITGGRRAAIELHDGSRIVATHVVVANGAWAGAILGSRRALPVSPLKGEIAFFPAVPLRHVVFGAGGYLVPRGAELMVGATSQRSNFDASTTGEATEALAAVADALLPAGAPWRNRLTRQVAGLRPVTPDLLPILGSDPDEPAIVYACGYSRNGVLLAPLAATCVAEAISGGTPMYDLAPFSVTRFAASGSPAG